MPAGQGQELPVLPPVLPAVLSPAEVPTEPVEPPLVVSPPLVPLVLPPVLELLVVSYPEAPPAVADVRFPVVDPADVPEPWFEVVSGGVKVLPPQAVARHARTRAAELRGVEQR